MFFSEFFGINFEILFVNIKYFVQFLREKLTHTVPIDVIDKTKYIYKKNMFKEG